MAVHLSIGCYHDPVVCLSQPCLLLHRRLPILVHALHEIMYRNNADKARRRMVSSSRQSARTGTRIRMLSVAAMISSATIRHRGQKTLPNMQLLTTIHHLRRNGLVRQGVAPHRSPCCHQPPGASAVTNATVFPTSRSSTGCKREKTRAGTRDCPCRHCLCPCARQGRGGG